MSRANALVASWMAQAGMTVRQDGIGNVIGRYAAVESPKSKVQSPKSKIHSSQSTVHSSQSRVRSEVLLLGSHLDTVRDAGKFDGALGVLVAIACVQDLHDQGLRLPFALEVVGLADEEGVRFQSAYLGSKALAGTLGAADFQRKDAEGITLRKAIEKFGGRPEALVAGVQIDSSRLLGYLEVHIEQGPILEQQNLAVGVVTGIAGQSRAKVTFTGRAGHAGTTPMNLRQDALCAGAEFILAVESLARGKEGLVATVGEVTALPGASNVIPGEVRLSLDARHSEDEVRAEAMRELQRYGRRIAAQRDVRFGWQLVQETAAVRCDADLTSLLDEAVKRQQIKTLQLHSGAGHDAAVLAGITRVAMLFVRCKGGISHHPDESVSVEDVELAIKVTSDFIQALAREN